ncbi:MAG: ABC transporter permease [Candidatus Aminicenantes bacterium]|nr:ABC transporter permease [Candidatus Aminicenantes bacterium]
MFKNYLIIALRNLKKHRGFSFINIAGLAIGIACCLLILLLIREEISFDRFHEQKDQIYRVITQHPGLSYMGTDFMAVTAAPLAPALMAEFPEVIKATRIDSSDEVIISTKNKRFYEDGFYWTDSHFFDVFSFPLLRGDQSKALSEPYSVIISKRMAQKYFGDEDPVGKTIALNNRHDFVVTGIMKDVPRNSHLQFDFLAPLITLSSIRGQEDFLESWGNYSYYTYILLPKGYSPGDLEHKFPAFFEKYLGEILRQWRQRGPSYEASRFFLQPLGRIHLYSHLNFEISPNSDIKQIYLLAALAFVTLLIACINYMNLATARSASRAKEVGMRKVVGAERRQLIRQFIGESIFFCCIAVLLAAVLVELFLPAFNSLIGKSIRFHFFHDWEFFIGLICLALVVGIISGSYPAFFLSTFRPVTVLKGSYRTEAKGSLLRKILVIFQFAASIILVISTIIIYSQIEYIRNKKLGFNREQVVVLPVKDRELRQNHEPLKNELLQNPAILGCTASTWLPNNIRTNVGDTTWEGKEEGTDMQVYLLEADYDFIDVFGIELVEGRNFSREFSTDSRAYIINETARKIFGWEKALGKRFGFRREEIGIGSVIGVVRDFHFLSLHQEMQPLVIHLTANSMSYLSLKISTENIPRTIRFLKERWQRFSPSHPFDYFFLDDDFEKMYRSEMRLGKIFASFAALAIFIACLGLFGLASFTSEQRTKEIGVRKVLGASVSNIVILLSKEFSKWVCIASLVAWPVAYYAMSRWLQSFAYRMSVGIWIFLLATILALFVAMATVSFKAVKSALANPVDALRYE